MLLRGWLPRVAIALAALGLCGFAGGADGSARDSPNVGVTELLATKRVVRHSVRAKIVVASPELRAVVTRVLGGLESSLLRKVRVGPPPASQTRRATRKLPANALWLYVDAVVRSGRSGAAKSQWAAYLLGGAVRDIATVQGLPPVVGVTVQPVLPNGSAAKCCNRTEGALPHRPPLAVGAPTRKALTTELRSNVKRAGLMLDSVTFQQPLGLAVEINVVVRGSISASELRRVLELIDLFRYEGFLLKLFDDSGSLLYSYSFSARASDPQSTPCPLGGCPPGYGGFPGGTSYPGVGSSAPPVPVPLNLESILVCPVTDTRLAPGTYVPLARVCVADRSSAPISPAEPVFCTAIVVGGIGHTLTVQIVREGAVVRVVALTMTGNSWYQTVAAGPPPTGPLECRVLVDSNVVGSRLFEIG